MANYNVQITGGTGSVGMKKGNYNVTVTANGFEATTLSPTALEVTGSAATANFTVSANGTLTLIFNETGASGGTAVTSGSVVMTDSSGTTQYGDPVQISATGEAVFDKVPFDQTTPYTLYFVQTATDDGHNVYEGVITVQTDQATQTEYVVNAPIALQTVNLTSADYSGLPVANAEMTFTAA